MHSKCVCGSTGDRRSRSPGALTPRRRRGLQFDSAEYAWEAGRYPEALERLERLLTGPARDSLLAPIALLTGELYRTREIAPDAADPRWSPDAGMLAYRDRRRLGTALRARHAQRLRRPSARHAAGLRRDFAPDGSEIAYIAADGGAAVLRPSVGRPGAPGGRSGPDRPGPGLRHRSRTAAAARDRRPVVPDGASCSRSAPARRAPLTGGARVTGLPLRAAGGRLVFASTEGVTVRSPDGTATVHRGMSPVVSTDGSTLAFVGREGGEWTIMLRAHRRRRRARWSARPDRWRPRLSLPTAPASSTRACRGKTGSCTPVARPAASRAGSPTRSSTTSILSS